MRLKSIYNNAARIAGYRIIDPSDEFKKLYPKKHIAASILKNKVYNFDDFNDLPIYTHEVDYYFTYEEGSYMMNSFMRFNPSNVVTIEDDLGVIQVDLSNYLIYGNKENDVIIKIVPKCSEMDPMFINSIVLLTNYKTLKNVEIKKSLQQLIKTVYNKQYFKSINTTEKWLINLLNQIPFNLFNEKYQFKSSISDKDFQKSVDVSIDNFLIGYATRIPNIQQEVKFIEMMEKDFANYKTDIRIYNDYTNILERIENEAKKSKMKYSKTDNYIDMKTEDFYKLNLEFEIINFLN